MFRIALFTLGLMSVGPCAFADQTGQVTVERGVFSDPRLIVGPGIDARLPAAIAVHLGHGVSFLWNSVDCRLLAIWSGDFLRTDEKGIQSPAGEVLISSTGPSPITVAPGAFTSPEFYGFELDADDVPTFHYLAGNLAISEKVTYDETEQTVSMHFSIQHSPTEELMLAFPKKWESLAAISAGRWEDNYFLISSRKAEDFSLSFDLNQLTKESPIEVPSEDGPSEKEEPDPEPTASL